MSNERPCGSEFLRQLARADEHFTQRLALAAKPDSPWGKYRKLFLLLEFSGHGVPCFFLTILMAWWVRDVPGVVFFVNLFFAQLFDLALITFIKFMCKRPRPQANQTSDMFLIIGPDNYSFPSGHSSRAIMLASVIILATNLNGPLKCIVLLWSLAVCGSRVVLGRHNVGDVAAGMVVGLLEYYVIMIIIWLHPRNAIYAASYLYRIPDHFRSHCSMTDTCEL